MGLFSSGTSDVRYGAIVDVGSGSVLVSIIKSDIASDHPEVVWSKREYVLLKDTVTVQQGAKNILTALMNGILALGKEGIATLKQTEGTTKIGQIQFSISAPWSYTISKTVNFTDDAEFEITKTLIAELTEAAQKKTLEELKGNEITELLGLEIIARTTTDLIANGYRTEQPYGQQTKKLSLAHVSAVAQQDLIEALGQAQEKIMPRAQVEKFSFMLVYYCVMRELYPTATEFCLVDVTFEATEIAIIRDGIFKYSTHAPYGSYTLARELSEALQIPKEEAFSLLKKPHEQCVEELPASKREAFQKVIRGYQQLITDLFKQTGDALTIPKTIYLHADLYTEMFFHNSIDLAAQEATRGSHIIHEVTSELLTKNYRPEEKKALKKDLVDTALLISAQFFHKQHHCKDFEQL